MAIIIIITHGSSVKFPLTDSRSGSCALFVDTLRTSVAEELVCPAGSRHCPWPWDILLLTTATPWRSTTLSDDAATPVVTSAVCRWLLVVVVVAASSFPVSRSWRAAERPDDDVAEGLKTTLSMIRCSARLDLAGLFGSVNRRNGDLMRRRRTPLWVGADPRPSPARCPTATSVVTSVWTEVTSLTHVSTAERWRRTAVWLTLAINDDLINASVLDILADWLVVLALMSLSRLLQLLNVITRHTFIQHRRVCTMRPI